MKNPYLYAGVASAYIGLVVLLLTNLERFDVPETPLAPIMMLSLLVLSVAIMGVLFFYEPLVLFMDGKRKEALWFVIHMIIAFAIITGIVLVIALLIR